MAPAVAHAGILMPVRKIIVPRHPLLDDILRLAAELDRNNVPQAYYIPVWDVRGAHWMEVTYKGDVRVTTPR
jgi:hypothetical protein